MAQAYLGMSNAAGLQGSELELFNQLKGFVSRFRIASPFGNRIHPFTGKPQFHNGIDLACPEGTPIYVGQDLHARIYWDAQFGGGLSCVVTASKYIYGFAHLSRIEQSGGKLVLYTGNTGMSTGPHLHLTMRSGGQFIDPAAVLKG